LGSVATPSITSWLRATPSETVARSSSSNPARRVTPDAAGASDGCPRIHGVLVQGDRQLDQEIGEVA